MGDFASLSCPSCGGNLRITKDIDRFACAYCGNEHIVKRSKGVVLLSPIVEGFKNISVGLDKTSAELAIARISGEISALEFDLSKSKSQENFDGVGKFILALVIGVLLISLNIGAIVYIVIAVAVIGIAYRVLVFYFAIKESAELKEQIIALKKERDGYLQIVRRR